MIEGEINMKVDHNKDKDQEIKKNKEDIKMTEEKKTKIKE
jgi:hypothetical protein